MSESPAPDVKLVRLLSEAYANERQLEVTLSAHADATPRDDYAGRLRDHLEETRSHAEQLSRRIRQLGGEPQAGADPVADGLSSLTLGVFERISLAKETEPGDPAPTRSESDQERMLHNARVEYADEAQEIATYMVIESLAAAVGDEETARLARGILREEERMQAFLAGLLPELAAGLARHELPEMASR